MVSISILIGFLKHKMSLREEKDGGGGRGKITTTTYNELITLPNSNNISN